MKKALTTFAIIAFVTVAARADVELAWDVSGHGSPVDSPLQASTVNSVLIETGVGDGLNELFRDTVMGVSAANSFNSNNWNTTNTFNENSRSIGFTIDPNTTITLTDLQYAINGSNTAPNQGLWGYTSPTGEPFVFQPQFTLANAAPSSLATWDFPDFTIAANTSTQFHFWAFGATSINGGTSDSGGIVGIADIAGNDLILHGFVVPEPTTLGLIGIGLVGVAAFARRRSHKA